MADHFRRKRGANRRGRRRGGCELWVLRGGGDPGAKGGQLFGAEPSDGGIALFWSAGDELEQFRFFGLLGVHQSGGSKRNKSRGCIILDVLTEIDSCGVALGAAGGLFGLRQWQNAAGEDLGCRGVSGFFVGGSSARERGDAHQAESGREC